MVAIRKVECPKEKYSIKCPYEMIAEGIVIHNTDNDATAIEEVEYMHRNSKKVSFHFAVDETEVVQGIDTNRNTWNAGDGTKGKGNRKYIAIEICRSYSKKKVNGKWVADEKTWEKHYKSKFEQAQKNAAELTAKILKEKGWGIDKVKRHKDFNGKNCPARTMSDYGWEYFLKLVEGYLNPKPVSTNTIKKGDLVSIKSNAKYYNGKKVPNWVAKQKWYVAEVSGSRVVINKNEKGTSAINSPINVMYLTVAKPTTVSKAIRVGSTVKVKLNSKDLNTGKKLALWSYARKYKVKELKGNRAVLTYNGAVITAMDIKNLTLA